MGFLSPWFLTGLAAIGLPVYIHLLRKHTTTPRLVSSLMFFERGTQSSTRHRRLRYLILFSLRALLILLLALVFANPFIRRSSAASDRLLIVAIDNSFSMSADGHLDNAKREALTILSGRRSSQRAQIMVLGNELSILTQPIQDSGALRAAVESIQPSDAHGNFGELGRGLRALGETVHTPIDLHVFSDMQASNMPANFADMVMPGNVSLMLHPTTKQAVPNWTVESIKAPDQLVDPKRARVVAVIAGHQTPEANRAVSLVVNGKVVATKKINVPADGRATVAFESLDVPYGSSRCQIRIDSADAFPKDDFSNFAVKRADPERVLFVHQSSDTRSPLFFGAALAAVAQASFILQPINVEQSADVDPTHYAFVVLSDVPSISSRLQNSLLHATQNGSNVLIATGLSESRRQRIPVFEEDITGAHFYSRTIGSSTVGYMDTSHPSLRNANNWGDAKFFYASVVKPGSSRIVARLADGTPLLLDKQIGEGHVLLLTSGLDNVTNDLPLYPAFVPFVDQSARYLSGMEQLMGARIVGSFVQLRSATNVSSANQSSAASIDIVGPDGHRPLSLKEESTAQSLRLVNAGFYQIRFASGRDALIAVNPDRRESAFDLIPDETLHLWSGGTPETQNRPGISDAVPAKTPYSLWWWFMLLVLIAALGESILASRYLGTQREDV